MSQAEIDLRNQIAMELYLKSADIDRTSVSWARVAQESYMMADTFIEEMRHQMSAIKEKDFLYDVGIDPVSNQAKNHAVVGLPFGNINRADSPQNK